MRTFPCGIKRRKHGRSHYHAASIGVTPGPPWVGRSCATSARSHDVGRAIIRKPGIIATGANYFPVITGDNRRRAAGIASTRLNAGNRYVERQPENGIAVAHRAGIMRHYIDSIQSEPTPVVPLVRWIFERRGNAITCKVDMTAPHTCNVSVIPHWNAASAFVEHFDGPVQAMERHAEVAQELRNAGWVVTRHLISRQRSL